MFEYPELVAHLVPYLTSQDMAHCAATCKTLAGTFKPYLYQHYQHFTGPVPGPVQRNAHYLRTLEIRGGFTDLCLMVLVQDESPSLPESLPTILNNKMTDLRRLILYQTVFIRGQLLIHALRANSGITHLELETVIIQDIPPPRTRYDLLGSTIFQHFLEIIRDGLPQLQRLVFIINCAAPVNHAAELLNACLHHPRLTEFQCRTRELRGSYHQDDSTTPLDSLMETLEHRRANASFTSPPGGQLKALALPFINLGYPQSFLLPLLTTYLPNLERFDIPPLGGSYADALEQVIGDYCSKLQHISYTFARQYNDSSSPIKAAIRGCAKWSGIRSFRVFGYNGTSHEDSGPRMVDILVEHHSATLEKIEFEGCERLGGRRGILDPIFTRCPNLKVFKVLPIDKEELNVLEFVDIPLDSWVFQDLKELHLHFAHSDGFVLDKGTAEEALEAGEKLMKQIGKLTKLETLFLRFTTHEYYKLKWADNVDPELEKVWLKELGGLRKLIYIGLPSKYWEKADQAEVEFMDASWPILERISCKEDYLLREISRRDQWQWLKQRRPWLKFGGDDGVRV